jgi:hypothetical protein
MARNTHSKTNEKRIEECNKYANKYLTLHRTLSKYSVSNNKFTTAAKNIVSNKNCSGIKDANEYIDYALDNSNEALFNAKMTALSLVYYVSHALTSAVYYATRPLRHIPILNIIPRGYDRTLADIPLKINTVIDENKTKRVNGIKLIFAVSNVYNKTSSSQSRTFRHRLRKSHRKSHK